MKTAIALLAILSLVVFAKGEGDAKWWRKEQPNSPVTRVVDMYAACKISVAGDKVALFRESGGQLMEYFTSQDAAFAAKTAEECEKASYAFVKAADGSFLRFKAATSADFQESSCTLRVGTIEIGKVTDAKAMETLQIEFGFKSQYSPLAK